jgi:hypothetical protein
LVRRGQVLNYEFYRRRFAFLELPPAQVMCGNVSGGE